MDHRRVEIAARGAAWLDRRLARGSGGLRRVAAGACRGRGSAAPKAGRWPRSVGAPADLAPPSPVP
eukprot:1617525-Alexandrium_andersonii.AAC.1